MKYLPSWARLPLFGKWASAQTTSLLAYTKCDVNIYLCTSLPCSFLSKTVVAIFQAVMVYRASALRGLAITQMVFAALMITFGAACIFSVNHWSSRVGFGVWVGSWVCIEDRALPLIIVLTLCVIRHYWYHFRASLLYITVCRIKNMLIMCQ